MVILMHDVLVVGAGFTGASAARALADAGYTVLVIDQRDHITGNAFDERGDEHGLLTHRYGPHIFHTSNETVWQFLSRFTSWRSYQHKVLSRHRGTLYPMPINRTTLEQFFDCTLADDAAAEALLADHRIDVEQVANSRDAVVSQVGIGLYEAFFEHYTRKQWNRGPEELDAVVCRRIPVRTDRTDTYFTDPHQAMPVAGFTALFKRMLDHPAIDLRLSTRFDPAPDRDLARAIIYTGPLDAWFGHRFGRLPYRSLRFEHQYLPDVSRHQPVGTVNEADPEVPYTRTTEFKHLTGDTDGGTAIVREYPATDGDPYYPVLMAGGDDLRDRYLALAKAEPGVWFAGRLAQFKYLNMDTACAVGLHTAQAVRDHLGDPT